MYDLVTLTSMGVRLTPTGHRPVGDGYGYTMQATSAESNVLNVSACLGLSVKALTGFVEGSPISAFIKGELRRRNIAYEGPDLDAGGPWGLRHQFNLADTGYGQRGPRVYNDRAGEVGRALHNGHFDFDRLFHQDGARILHLSGLFAALSPGTAELCLQSAAAAAKHGTLVSFDLNHRASFWAGREHELREVFLRIASLSDILIGNEEDYQLALGLEGVPTDGRGLAEKTAAYQHMIEDAQKKFPSVRLFANTLREVENANCHHWGAMLCDKGQWHTVSPRPIGVLDRIGGGDGFVGGLLYGLLKGWDAERCLHFGWACGALAVTTEDDYASPSDEEQVWNIWKGNARVQR